MQQAESADRSLSRDRFIEQPLIDCREGGILNGLGGANLAVEIDIVLGVGQDRKSGIAGHTGR